MKLLIFAVLIALAAGCEPRTHHYRIHPNGTADIDAWQPSWDSSGIAAFERALERAAEQAERRRQHLRAQI